MGNTAFASDAYEIRRDVDALGDVLVRRIEERVDAHPRLRHVADRVHHAVELVAVADHLGDAVGERAQVLLVLHVELEQRRLLREPVGDPLDQPHPVEPGEYQLGARLLGDLGDVEPDRGVGDDPRDEDPLALQKCHVKLLVLSSGPCPCRHRRG